jgi:hypothetical protein
MQSFLKNNSLILLLVASLFLMGADKGAQGTDDQAKLLEQQKRLNTKIERLKLEQDYLLFQKMMCASDSKYLVINVRARTGQLKYKNRILRDFHFTSAGHVRMLKQGALTLTRKIEKPKKRNLLIFGTSLVLQGRRIPAIKLQAGIPRFSLSKKDFLSVFYAVEAGAKAYLIL